MTSSASLHSRDALRLVAPPVQQVQPAGKSTRHPGLSSPRGPLNVQLAVPVQQGANWRIVVEYGDIQGLITPDDILEEIVGDFTTST